ncbi:MAG TPA: hypothetical protein VHA73_07525 [Acidimicrobiales bacterium]|nr:hypothetical protein [Acidimicrobiales bacterium]
MTTTTARPATSTLDSPDAAGPLDTAAARSAEEAAGGGRRTIVDHWSGRRRSWARTFAAGLVLLIAYFGLSLLNAPKGFLGTDTGGKVATLRAMDQRGSFTDIDVGYWAARWDADGTYHPLWYTTYVDGKWIQATTVPMLLAAEPLYRLGGERLALLLPMLGAVACAFTARALARRFGADGRAGWWAFWLVGLASPVTIYALDLWEHTLGLALMAWGVVAMVDLLADKARPPRRIWLLGLAGGCAFGAAATMRTEALVYGAAFTAAAGLVALGRRRIRDAWRIGVGSGFGVVLFWLGNARLEHLVVGSGIRAGRAAGTAAGGGDGLAERVREGLVTTFGSRASFDGEVVLVGVGIGLVVLVLAWTATRRDASHLMRLGAAGLLVLLYLTVVGGGLGFVPGLVVTTPLAVLGCWAAVSGARFETRVAVLAAVAALPVVWLFQFTGGALPQWGGRYVLCTGFVLSVAAMPALAALGRRERTALVGCAVAITSLGVAWTSARTHDVARDVPKIEAQPEQVLVADQSFAHLWREGGAFTGGRELLTIGSGGTLRGAAEVVGASGADTFGLVHSGTPAPAQVAGFHRTGRVRLSFLGLSVDVDRYVRS